MKVKGKSQGKEYEEGLYSKCSKRGEKRLGRYVFSEEECSGP